MKTRNTISWALMLALGVALTPLARAAQDVAPPAWRLTPDSTIKLITLGRYSSGSSKRGDRVDLQVDEDVTDSSGNVLIRKGTRAYGAITRSRRAGTFGKKGVLHISVDYTTSVDGQKIPLRATKTRDGTSNQGVSVAAFVLLTPVAFFIKGSNASVPENTQFIAFVDDTMNVKPSRLAPQQSNSVDDNPPPTAQNQKRSIILRNGDRITGVVTGLADGVYTVVTDNGTLSINQTEVERIEDIDAR